MAFVRPVAAGMAIDAFEIVGITPFGYRLPMVDGALDDAGTAMGNILVDECLFAEGRGVQHRNRLRRRHSGNMPEDNVRHELSAPLKIPPHHLWQKGWRLAIWMPAAPLSAGYRAGV